MDRQTEVATYSTTRTSPYRLATDESTSDSSSRTSEKIKPYWGTPGSQPCNQKSTGKEAGLTTLNYPSYSELQTLEKLGSRRGQRTPPDQFEQYRLGDYSSVQQTLHSQFPHNIDSSKESSQKKLHTNSPLPDPWTRKSPLN